MIKALKTIVSVIGTLIQFLINAITGLVNLFTHIPQYLAYTLEMVAILPPYVIPFVTAFVTLAVLLFMINRGK